jgi:omega-6 fatty acid desaturase (delta-12 desaturase)
MTTQVTRPEWYRTIVRYQQPDRRKAVWQLVNTFGPYFALWALMVWMVRRGTSYWLVLPLIVIAAALLVRLFIFFHDCCHGSFFASRRANRILGYVTGILAFTPYEYWRRSHAGHHATAGDLDRRGGGDIWTMTVEEYRAAVWWRRLAYRAVRNPFVIFILGPLFVFVIGQRFSQRGMPRRERNSVVITNVALLTIAVVASLTIGWRTYLVIQLPVMLIAGSIGLWMFYVQHQFEGVYWARHEEWDPVRAALEGSSYYKLPKVLQWFSGNIGLHHIHHLRARIPNYHLQRCYNETPAVQGVKPLTLRGSLKCPGLNVYDEKQRRLVSFRALKTLPQPAA